MTIEPGVSVLLASQTAIVVFGSLQVAGTEEEPVIFDSLEAETNWGGIYIEGADTIARISNAHFQHAEGGIFREITYPGGVTVHYSFAFIEQCLFEKHAGDRYSQSGIDAA